MDQLNTQFQKHLCFSFLIKYDWKFTPHGEIFFTIRCKNTPNSVKVDFYTSKCKKKVKFNRKIVSLVGESFYTKGCKSVKVNFYTLWCNGQHSGIFPPTLQSLLLLHPGSTAVSTTLRILPFTDLQTHWMRHLRKFKLQWFNYENMLFLFRILLRNKGKYWQIWWKLDNMHLWNIY